MLTAAGVALVGLLAALVVPASATQRLATVDAPLALAGTVGIAAGAANVVNNLPATLIGLEGVHSATWGMWAWLLGVNTGSVILPIGALANILWWRIVRREGVEVNVRTYVRATVPVAVPALIAAALCLAAAGSAMSVARSADDDGHDADSGGGQAGDRVGQRPAATHGGPVVPDDRDIGDRARRCED